MNINKKSDDNFCITLCNDTLVIRALELPLYIGIFLFSIDHL